MRRQRREQCEEDMTITMRGGYDDNKRCQGGSGGGRGCKAEERQRRVKTAAESYADICQLDSC